MGTRRITFLSGRNRPYEYGEGDQAAYLREEQYKATRLIPNSGIVSTNDLVQDYEKRQIHPKEKSKDR